MHSQSQTQRALTILELIISIAVILVLIALLNSALQNATVQAARTRDAANLRSMAQSILNYHADHGILPGRVNRGIRIPSTVPPNERDRWVSTMLIDHGYVGEGDDMWSAPLDYGVNQNQIAYVLNNTVESLPRNFFGLRGNTTLPPRRINELIANVRNRGFDENNRQPLGQLWMVTNADGENYGSSATADSIYAIPSHLRTPWNGRHYVFFDGRVELIRKPNYPSHN